MPCDLVRREIILPIMNKLVSERGNRDAGFPMDDERLNDFLENQIHNDPVFKGKNHAKIEREFRKLQAESPAALRVWVQRKLDEYIELSRKAGSRSVKDEAFRRLRSGPPDRFRRQLEESGESWVVA